MKCLFSVFILFFVLNAQASRWYKKSFKSREGIQIDVSYQLIDYTQYSSRHAVYPIHFEVIGLTYPSNAKVVFINKLKDLSLCGRNESITEEIFQEDLLPFGRNYTAYLTDKARHHLIVDLERDSYCRHQVSAGQEFAIVVNGYWLQDPISSSSNFKINFDE